ADIRNGNVHIVVLSTGAVSTAVNTGGAVPFAVMADAKDNYGYKMQLIVPASSSLRLPGDLRGQNVSFVSAYSHSGFKAPVVILWKEFGLLPGRNYDTYMQGSQEQLADGIANNRLP